MCMLQAHSLCHQDRTLEFGTELSVQDLPGGSVVKSLHTPNTGGMGSIPGQGSKIPYAPRHSQRH